MSHFAVGTLRIAKTEAALDDLSLCFVSGLPAVYDKSHLTMSHIDTSSHCTSWSKNLKSSGIGNIGVNESKNTVKKKQEIFQYDMDRVTRIWYL